MKVKRGAGREAQAVNEGQSKIKEQGAMCVYLCVCVFVSIIVCVRYLKFLSLNVHSTATESLVRPGSGPVIHLQHITTHHITTHHITIQSKEHVCRNTSQCITLHYN